MPPHPHRLGLGRGQSVGSGVAGFAKVVVPRALPPTVPSYWEWAEGSYTGRKRAKTARHCSAKGTAVPCR